MPRPTVLNKPKRCEIVALAAHGLSRRAIAQYVGCAAATIENTARRDPAFARELVVARQKFIRRQLQQIENRPSTDRPTSNRWTA